MKRFIIVLLLAPFLTLNAQNVGINEANPDASAALEITSTNTGLLIPRVALTGTASASPVTSPATSLLVYNTATVSDVTPGYYYWNGTAWEELGGSGGADADWEVIGNDVISGHGGAFPSGNIGIGTTTPATKLEVKEGVTSTATIPSGFTTHISHSVNAPSSNGLLVTNNWQAATSTIFEAGSIFAIAPFTYTPRLVVLGDGNVGINDNTPNAKLEIEMNQTSGIIWDALELNNTNETVSSTGRWGVGIKFHNTNDAAVSQLNRWAGIAGISEQDWGTSVGLAFYTNDWISAPTEKMRITKDGHVGIGLSAPLHLLSVSGKVHVGGAQTAINGQGAYINWNHNSTTTTNGLAVDQGMTHIVNQQGLGPGGFEFDLFDSSNNFLSSPMIITAEGKVGINIIAPGNNQLASISNEGSFSGGDGSIGVGVYGSATQSETLYGVMGEAFLSNWNSNDLMTGVCGTLSWSGNKYAEGYLSYHDSENDFTGLNALVGVAGRVTDLYTNNGKNSIAGYFENAYIGTGGNKTVDSYGVYAISSGVGTTGSVNYGIYATASGAVTNHAGYFEGDVCVTNDLYVAGDIHYLGSALNSGACPSDRRYKKEVANLESSLDKVLQVNGVNYYWKQEEFKDKLFMNDRRQTGLIAQDFELLFPDLVNTDDKGYKSVNYAQYTAVLTEAIKELNQKIENLEEENKQLKASNKEIENLKAEIEDIKSTLNISAIK